MCGDVCEWPFGDSPEERAVVLDETSQLEVQPILYSLYRGRAEAERVPPPVWEAFREAHFATLAAFEFRQLEIRRVLAALAQQGVDPVLFKGIPLALTVYEQAHHRPSSDVDLLVRKVDLPKIRVIMRELGYRVTPDLIFGTLSQQVQFWRESQSGLEHLFEFHLQVNNRSLLAPFRYEDFQIDYQYLPDLGPRVRGMTNADGLLMGLVHCVGHLPGDRRFLWHYDLVLLIQQLSSEEWKRIRERVAEHHLHGVVASELATLAREWGVELPEEVRSWVAQHVDRRDEPSSYYLSNGRTARSDFRMGWWYLSTWRDRLWCLWQLLIPGWQYMRAQNPGRTAFGVWLGYPKRWLGWLRPFR